MSKKEIRTVERLPGYLQAVLTPHRAYAHGEVLEALAAPVRALVYGHVRADERGVEGKRRAA